jgi:two-component system, OmpR family, sensor histidine kinase KdpD
MEDGRPDPDLLIGRMLRDTDRKREGQLKIFFGAAPGVGKTYAMLQAAQQKLAEGVDVVVGLVETHKRKETEALLVGLEVIPRHTSEYRDVKLTEFDIDAALSRKPALILVDELAHTNVPGSRHKKRWQDIYELLGAGISVYTTVNTQHLESLNDIVAQITGITIHETVPDFLLDRADEIELIDLPPDDLLQRLKEGKVYVPDLAVQASHNFFRKGNLLALRELALRRTAERVDEQMQQYREVKGVKDVWPAADRILVCVGPNPSSIRLIRAAKRMAASLKAEWLAVYVEAPHKVKPSDNDLRQLMEHMRLAESLGAETITLSGHKASDEIINYARERNVTKIIVGKPTHPMWKDKVFGSMLDAVVRGSGDIDVYVITGDTAEPAPRPVSKTTVSKRPPERGWLLSIVTVVVCTGIAALMDSYVPRSDLAMVYLLGIVFTASRAGKLPFWFSILFSILSFDFFFVPPRYSFYVSSPGYVITFAVMIIVSLVISRLTIKVRDQANTVRHRERRTADLYGLSRKLVHERGIEQLSTIAAMYISEVFSSNVVILVPDEKGMLTAPSTGPVTFDLDQKELSVAEWTYKHGQKAGLETDTLSGAKAVYLPLVIGSQIVGVMGVMPDQSGVLFDQEQIHMLESFANQIAMAIDRAMIAKEAQAVLLKAETEELRSTLLSSVSHDLRTPLAVITGATTTLLQKNVPLETSESHDLLQTIYEESEHLKHIIRNVLDMTRIETKAITVKKEWESIEEITGAVLNRLSEELVNREVTVAIPPEIPLVPFDPLLIEQVLSNLIDNAIKYTPADTPISLTAYIDGKSIVVELADRGAGIPAGEEERIFEKFVRGSSAGGGIGLGLTICRAIINAHGGRIWVENRPKGGAIFRFTLPISEHPPVAETDEDKL